MKTLSKADRNNRRKDTREQILNIAQNIMATQGVSALTLRKISEQLGIQPPSIYTHFSSIDAIFEAVSVRVYKSFTRIKSAAEGSSAEESLAVHIGALIDHMAENPVYIQLMLHDFASVRAQDNLAEAVETQIDASFQNVQKMLDRGYKEGAFRQVPADQYLAYIFGAGLISLSWTGFGPEGALKPVAPVAQIKSDLLKMAKAYLAVE